MGKSLLNSITTLPMPQSVLVGHLRFLLLTYEQLAKTAEEQLDIEAGTLYRHKANQIAILLDILRRRTK